MKKLTIICVLLIVLPIVYSKGYSRAEPLTNTQQSRPLKINTFTEIPDEIDGCVIYLYRSKNDKKLDKYICVNDFAQMAFVNIDNKLTKFALIKHSRLVKTDVFLYKSESYQLKIEMKTLKATGAESTTIMGTMTVEDTVNRKTTLNFIGKLEC